MTVLHLVRHGETDWNRDRRVQGATDIPLNDTGRQQARDAASRFAALEDPPSVVVSSDLARASETARIVASALGLAAPTLHAGLRERSYGDSEGMDSREVVARWGDWRTSQIPGAEPWPALRARAVTTIAAIARDVGDTRASVLVVTHGAFIREFVRHATGDRLPEPDTRLGNLDGVRVVTEGDRMLLLDAAPV